MNNKYDTLIIGSGIAGLNLARKLAQAGQRVFLASKEAVTEGSSKYAQGGVAVVSPLNPEDKSESHIEDTLRAGWGLCDPEVVSLIIDSAWSKLEELIKLGVNFDKDFNIEGSHSYSRVMHVADATGRAILKPLLDKVSRNHRVSIAQGSQCLSLIKSGDFVVGARFRDIEDSEYDIWAQSVVLATGGLGALYLESSNPSILTGDGIALAYDAGAEIRDLEFVQFHPTVFFPPSKAPLLITEAVRGAGALLRNTHGELFAERYHPEAELATRDIVSRAIVQEMKLTKSDFVYLDFRVIDSSLLETKFPNIYKKSLTYGYDLKTDLLPVRPAAHYTVGGIRTDVQGRTRVKGLYALGEVASTALHGANRLASNSLLECIVVSDFLADTILAESSRVSVDTSDFSYSSSLAPVSHSDLLTIRRLVSRAAGLEREEQTLLEAIQQLALLPESLVKTTASLLLKMALERRESRGTHYRSDYPLSLESASSQILCQIHSELA